MQSSLEPLPQNNWFRTSRVQKMVPYMKVKLIVPNIHDCFFNQNPVPERPISCNAGFKFCSIFCIYLPMHCLKWHFVLSFLFFEGKAKQYFGSSSYMFLDKKTLLKIVLTPGLKLTIFRGTGPRPHIISHKNATSFPGFSPGRGW